ncbi:MAG TPA: hypothetical protein VGQ17_09475 [Gemmatimonadales bacterium]|jgi:hypothetical protein|nr:hypothetical protein [Gemmatimonadales bacterium]
MHSPARRRLIKGLAALAPLPFVARRFHGLAVADLDPALLRALGAAILPGELGGEGIERIVAGFERWLAGYREGAELLHGYGSGEIRRTGPSPALRWAGQLRELDQAARKAGGKPFAALDLPARQEQVRAALQGARLAGLPPVDRAPHLAVGLLAFFYGSAEAADLCYGARIGRNSCRPLDESSRMPLPRAGGR